MIDSEGFRPNVGIIIVNQRGESLWARRRGQHSWQFPQGGIDADETPEMAMYRELEEEVGLKPEDVKLLGQTKNWLRYRIPKRFQRNDGQPVCIGQKQRWFLLKLITDEKKIRFDAVGHPEFDDWAWVNYWYPLRQVVAFKREVYRNAMQELFPIVREQQIRRFKNRKRRHHSRHKK